MGCGLFYFAAPVVNVYMQVLNFLYSMLVVNVYIYGRVPFCKMSTRATGHTV